VQWQLPKTLNTRQFVIDVVLAIVLRCCIRMLFTRRFFIFKNVRSWENRKTQKRDENLKKT